MAKTKTKKAPCECVNGQETYHKAESHYENGTWTNVWECENCCRETPRKVYTREERQEPSPSQYKAALQIISRWASLSDVVHSGRIQYIGRKVFWSGIVGPASRQGCLPLCDKSFCYCIGANGAVEDVLAKNGIKS